jgi:ATP-dependent DNA helicase RecG
VGPARCKALGKLGVATQRDLLFLLPVGVQHWAEPCSLDEAAAQDSGAVRVRGRLEEVRLTRFGGRRSALRAELVRGDQRLNVVWFNQPWVRERIPSGEEVELAGQMASGRSGPVLSNPRMGREDKPLPEPGSVEPLYPAGDGMSGAWVGALCRSVAHKGTDHVNEPLTDRVLAEHRLPPLPRALLHLHCPPDAASFKDARRRVYLESLLAVQARLQLGRTGRQAGRACRAELSYDQKKEIARRFPFQFTPGQKEVLGELCEDLSKPTPMRRLLQGDVGSGKTAMALYAAMAVIEANGQAALMAPTEILAEQHYYGSRAILAEVGIEAGLLTGSLPPGERRYLLQRLERGEIQMLFGTHALFSEKVIYARLALVVIDEQHRFGVDQREALAQKGEDAHLLLMTATPIPRTLAMTLYGDLDVSTLKGMPPGRGDLTTHWLRGPERRGLSKKLLPRLERGEQVFWVCPRITGDAGGRTASAERRYEQALASDLAQFGVELAHGRIPAEERSYRLDRFRSGEVGLLVATTVIEVGVDVPGATVMVIENAERLGLAQLHQLRGRVGRGPKDSVCYLLGDKKAEKRLRLLEKSRDGFELAEADMETRGMGDLAGVRQSGANLEGLGQEDVGLLILARELIRMEEGLGRMYVGQIGQVTP